MKPCWQNCGHGASNTHTSTRRMRLVTYSAPCPPPPRQQARSTESLSESVCVDVRDRVWALMRGARREEHPTVRWFLGPVSVFEAERDTM